MLLFYYIAMNRNIKSCIFIGFYYFDVNYLSQGTRLEISKRAQEFTVIASIKKPTAHDKSQISE